MPEIIVDTDELKADSGTMQKGSRNTNINSSALINDIQRIDPHAYGGQLAEQLAPIGAATQKKSTHVITFFDALSTELVNRANAFERANIDSGRLLTAPFTVSAIFTSPSPVLNWISSLNQLKIDVANTIWNTGGMVGSGGGGGGNAGGGSIDFAMVLPVFGAGAMGLISFSNYLDNFKDSVVSLEQGVAGEVNELEQAAAAEVSGFEQGVISGAAALEQTVVTEVTEFQLGLEAEVAMLEKRVEAEKAELDLIVSNFLLNIFSVQPLPDNSLQCRPPFITRNPTDFPPQNMQQLAQQIDDLYGKGTPIRVIYLGKDSNGHDQYLILVTGSENGANANNWYNAVLTGLGWKSDYQKQLDGILMGLPAGSIVNMAGHSQGGIAINNAAANPEINKHITINSLITFGAPVSLLLPTDTKIKTYRYAAVGDIVPLLSLAAINVLVEIGKPFSNPVQDVEDAGQLIQTPVPGEIHWSLNPGDMIGGSVKDSHFAYEDPNSPLKNTPLPFDINQWPPSDYYYAEHASGELPKIDKPL